MIHIKSSWENKSIYSITSAKESRGILMDKRAPGGF